MNAEMQQDLSASGEKLQQLDGEGGHEPLFYDVLPPISMVEDVRAFTGAVGGELANEPTFPQKYVRELRWSLLQEEVNELGAELRSQIKMDEAFETRMANLAKEIVDVIYVAIGTALACGIPIERVWEEVQRSNMAKVDPVTGKVKRRVDGKILKPDGWQKPDVEGVMFAR